jgi:CDP-paratose 2-epimerase
LQVLITGGAGFVGSSLGVALANRHPDWQITSLDNLHRRVSELNLPRLRQAGVRFEKADVRDVEALARQAPPDVLVECSAEPSALAGLDGETRYVYETNLTGAYNCLELARRTGAALLFLSTSRVYPFTALCEIAIEEAESRFEIAPGQTLSGVGPAGIGEGFPLAGARTLYGATKLAAELLIAEYAAAFGLRAIVDRCGVIAGPWQMGRVDQGIFSFWMLHHFFRIPLRYIGFGGTGKQVRDLLHVDDLVELIDQQLSEVDAWAGATLNVGGGLDCSLSLAETTAICRELTGNEVPIGAEPRAREGDVPVYISDCAALFERTSWRPRHDARRIMSDILGFVEENSAALRGALGLAGTDDS